MYMLCLSRVKSLLHCLTLKLAEGFLLCIVKPKTTLVDRSLLNLSFGVFKIAKTLNQFYVSVAHKPVKTLGSILKKNKDKLEKIYPQSYLQIKSNANIAKKVYIGQTLCVL